MAKDDLTYEDVVAAVARKEFSPLYLLYGEEDFLIEETADAVMNAALTPDERGFNLDIMYGNEADAKDVISHASSFPMAAERRVVIVRDADKLSHCELLTHYIEQPSPTTSLILSCAKPDFRKKPFVTLKKKAVVVECNPLWENQIPTWISRRVKKEKREIHLDAASMLAAYVGNSLRELVNELEKLYIYAGEKKSITVDDIAAVVGISKEFSVFELQWAIGACDVGKATEILERMLAQGEQPVMMVAVLTRFFQTLWKLHDVKRRGIQGNQQYLQSGIFSFADRYAQAAARFSVHQIEEAFLALSDVDEKLKSTSTDSKLLMQTFIVRVAQRPTHAYA